MMVDFYYEAIFLPYGPIDYAKHGIQWLQEGCAG